MTTKTLSRVEAEVTRFLDRLKEVREIEKQREALKETKVYIPIGTRKHGALRRSAHDLKEILTLITQNRDVE